MFSVGVAGFGWGLAWALLALPFAFPARSGATWRIGLGVFLLATILFVASPLSARLARGSGFDLPAQVGTAGILAAAAFAGGFAWAFIADGLHLRDRPSSGEEGDGDEIVPGTAHRRRLQVMGLVKVAVGLGTAIWMGIQLEQVAPTDASDMVVAVARALGGWVGLPMVGLGLVSLRQALTLNDPPNAQADPPPAKP